MNTRQSVLVVFLLAGTQLLAAQTQEGWHELKSPEGNFKILFPEMPEYETRNLPIQPKNVKMHIYTTVLREGVLTLMVSYADFPDDIIKKDPADTHLKDILIGALGNGKLLKETAFKLGQHPGKEYQFTRQIPDGMTVHCTFRAYLVGNRIYKIGVLGIDRPPNAEFTQKFIGTFSLLQRK